MAEKINYGQVAANFIKCSIVALAQAVVAACEDVFTFHKEELQRFEKLIIETFEK